MNRVTEEQIAELNRRAAHPAAGQPHPLSPDRWFDDGRFIPARLAEAARNVGHLKRGHDGQLYAYRDGVYRPDGETFVREFVRDQLDEKFRANHVREVTAWLEAEPPSIGADQPEAFVNVANGLIEWRTGQLRPHSPDVLTTVQHPVTYDADASCPAADRFIREVVPDDAYEFALELIGYALYPGGNPYRKAVQFLGDGWNGKSKFLDLIRRLVGPKNSAAVTLQALAENRFAPAELYGKAVNIAGDIDARAIRQSDQFKMLTGGDPVQAERKYQSPFTFICRAVPFFSANEPPLSSDQTPAWFDRWLIVPFTRNFRDSDDDDPNILDKITTARELSGLLNLALEGMRQLVDRGGFDPPASVAAAGNEYRSYLDSAAAFVEEECVFDVEASTPRSDLYRAYKSWCSERGRMPLNDRNFYQHLRRNYPHIDERKSGVWQFYGIEATS